MLINLSNHPIEKWSQEQINAAIAQFGELKDFKDVDNKTFPNIPPEWNSTQVALKAQEVFTEIINQNLQMAKENQLSILLAGELSFVIYFNTICKSNDVPVYVATSNRNTKDNPDGTKSVHFMFNQFRKL